MPDQGSHPDPASTFTLAPGVKLEPLGDGSAVLYSKELDQSLSLNHTAALLCTFADGQHTLSVVLQEMRQIFPENDIEESALAAFLADLRSRQFLQWS
jgi:Coenzyme PQQ synthesis protein D (PqqD)